MNGGERGKMYVALYDFDCVILKDICYQCKESTGEKQCGSVHNVGRYTLSYAYGTPSYELWFT